MMALQFHSGDTSLCLYIAYLRSLQKETELRFRESKSRKSDGRKSTIFVATYADIMSA